jgi:hypothetical protein
VLGREPVTTLIVMFIVLNGQLGPSVQGWHSIEACNAAGNQVIAEVKRRQGASTYGGGAKVICLEFPNPEKKG